MSQLPPTESITLPTPSIIKEKVILADTSPVSPTLASFKGRLYLGWKGAGNNYLNVMSSEDNGKTFGHKRSFAERSPGAPSLCVHNGNLYIAWKGGRNDNLNVARLPHGRLPHGRLPHGRLPHGDMISNKVILADTSPVSPTLASFKGRLYLGWKGAGNNYLNVMSSEDNGKTFGHKHTFAERSPEAPSLCVHNGNLYIAWKGDGNDNLNVARLPHGRLPHGNMISNKVILDDTSPVSPTLASFNGRLYLGWKGAGNNYLNVMYSEDNGKTFGHKHTSAERSPKAPSLCVHNGNLYIAWKGDGNDKLNVAIIKKRLFPFSSDSSPE